MNFAGHKYMKNCIYIFTNGILKRKDNTLFYLTNNNQKKYLPVEHIKEIYAFGEFELNAKTLNFLSQKNIILHYFNYYGYYAGTFYPREHYNSGYMILNQTNYYLDENKRFELARKFIKGASLNALKNLKYYYRRGKKVNEQIEEIERLNKKLQTVNKLEKIMAVEGQIKQTYYRAFDSITRNDDFKFEYRSKRSPKNYINSLISFANSIIYTQVLSEIYQTHLDPRIGYLHTTNFRRFTLNLDIAEIFKPVIGDKTILSLINKRVLSSKNFDDALKGIILNEKGKKLFLKRLEKRLSQTIKHHKLKRKVSYRRLMRLELYKLEKHLMGEEKYNPFVMGW